MLQNIFFSESESWKMDRGLKTLKQTILIYFQLWCNKKRIEHQLLLFSLNFDQINAAFYHPQTV